jgi:hypothetical protein
VSAYLRSETRLTLTFTAVDIYDGDKEPVVYHGKTLTTKVSLREVCEAIVKYAFVVSPYPIIISAEVHCSVSQQDIMSSIMHEVFGESLVCAPVDGRPKIEVLPSPEDLKGRVLLKVCPIPRAAARFLSICVHRRRIYTCWRARKSSRMSSRLTLNLPRRPPRHPRMAK